MVQSIVEILLVEDNPDDVEMALLGLEPYRVSNHIKVISDGAEALEYLFGQGRYTGRDTTLKPKIILLDLKLPLVDGLEVLARIKTDPRTWAIPVVMLTASREERDLVESYQLGVNSYIVKPLSFTQFVDAMRDVGMYWLMLNEVPHL